MLPFVAGPVKFRQQRALQENWGTDGAGTRVSGPLADRSAVSVHASSSSWSRFLAVFQACRTSILSTLRDTSPSRPVSFLRGLGPSSVPASPELLHPNNPSLSPRTGEGSFLRLASVLPQHALCAFLSSNTCLTSSLY